VRAEEELIKYRDHLEELVKERTQELKQRAEELAKANEELKELDKRKTEFLSTVSHELRTPLTPIKQYLQNMLSEMYGAVNEKQKKRSEMALTCVNDEARLIENLLDLVRIQENRIQTDLEFGSIADIVHRIIHRFEYSAKEKHLELKLNMPDEDCLMINIDREKIRQIITNLVHNAIKFTEKGTVTVSVFSENEKIKVCVSDTGIGIPDSQIEKIFERFYQIDSSFTRKVGGTGIGLNIVKKFVELHGGKIWVENNKDCAGTCFTFTLPKGQEVEII
jgi:signal transduction histidine kinase